MRKLVIPALPTASIPDPDRGDVLPPGGRVVDWTPHWALMALRGEVTVADPSAEPDVVPGGDADLQDTPSIEPVGPHSGE